MNSDPQNGFSHSEKVIRLVLPYPVGVKFNNLTVVSRVDNDRFGRTRWLCDCDCGKQTEVALFRLRSGHTKSCGCAKIGNVSHGKSRTKTHNSWLAMKQRCYYEKSEQFKHYGARGIKVCERWLNSFENFLTDMGERPDGMTLDRVDSNGDYTPENCRWATEEKQSRNRRSTIRVRLMGKEQCVKDWCGELNLNVDRVYGRIRRGMSPEEAMQP